MTPEDKPKKNKHGGRRIAGEGKKVGRPRDPNSLTGRIATLEHEVALLKERIDAPKR